MAQRLKVLSVLAEYAGSVLSAHMEAHNHLYLQGQGSDVLCRLLYTCGTHKFMQVLTHTHITHMHTCKDTCTCMHECSQYTYTTHIYEHTQTHNTHITHTTYMHTCTHKYKRTHLTGMPHIYAHTHTHRYTTHTCIHTGTQTHLNS